nr:response regulator [Allochromatium palmeri]
MIVDDMFAMRKLIAAVVREMGIEQIAEANSGQNALDHLARFPIDLLICDWNMPGMTGLEVLMAVRADPRLQTLPVLMVTAEQSAQQVSDAIQAGVTSYVAKPFLPPTLKLHIHKCLMRGESASNSPSKS